MNMSEHGRGEADPPSSIGDGYVVANTAIPVVDFSAQREEVAKAMVKASEEFGFFKVVNHGVSRDVISDMEDEAIRLFALPPSDKERGGPTDPYGYGRRTIGRNGDLGWIEYLLLPCHFQDIQRRYKSISPHNYVNFCNIVNKYIGETRKVACQVLELLAQGMGLPENSFSRLVMDKEDDSAFRLNYYPPLPCDASECTIGFGEHTDPQILTVLHSNDVGGLQVLVGDGNWVAVPLDPFSFSVNIGDCLQALTNGRLRSVRHRVVVKKEERRSRVSMMFFAAPPLDALVTTPKQLLDDEHNPSLYRPFSWREYKKSIYTFKLGNSLLQRFRVDFPPS